MIRSLRSLTRQAGARSLRSLRVRRPANAGLGSNQQPFGLLRFEALGGVKTGTARKDWFVASTANLEISLYFGSLQNHAVP